MASVYDYEPSGYHEWFVNAAKYRYGNLNKPQVIPSYRLRDITAISVLEAQIPYTFYTINANNNLLYMRPYSGSTGLGVLTLTIPPGNYTSTTIGPAIVAAVSAGITPIFASNFSVTYSTLTGKLSFTHSTNFFDLLFASGGPNQCAAPLGFDIRSPVDFVAVPVGTPLVAPNTIALGGPSYLFIRGSMGLSDGDMVVCQESEDNKYGGNLLAMVPINTVPGGTITWKNMAPRGGFFNFSSASIEEGTFWVTTGDDNTVVDFNGHPFQFKIGMLSRTRANSLLGSKYTSDRGVTSSVMR